MANPPVNRRPGVDADIIQGTWVRGYDVPAGDQTLPAPFPCDLIISNGKSQIDQTLSNLIFANRTDAITQPVFVMAAGVDPTAPTTTANFHVGIAADPNGVITGIGPGSFYTSTGTPALWQLQADNTTWVQISDDLGGEDLQQTLAIGNTTGGFNILLTNGDFLKGENSAVGAGASANIAGGNATGVLGNGGQVLLQGGSSVGGVTGGITMNSPTASGTGGSGAFSFITGESKLGGNSGSVTLAVGEAGDVGFGGTGGGVSIRAGRNRSSGAGAFYGGTMEFVAGQATSQGQGGNINLRAGPASDFDTFIAVPVATAGQGGAISLTAGYSSQSRQGGGIFLRGGTGGTAGAQGGNITFLPGNGGGGFPKGEVIADGVFRSDNIQRGSGDPNGSVSGDEGDVYQRTDAGVGQIWLNTGGTNTSWVQLAAVGDFIESFEQLNWGYFSRAGIQVGGSPEDAWSDIGIFKGLRSNSTAGDDPTSGGNLDNGPYISFVPPADTDVSAIDMSGGAGSLPHAREQRFILTFRARNAVSSTNGRIFLGVSTLDAITQLSSPIPGGGSYLGFVLDGSVGSTWRVVTSNGLGVTGPLNTGVNDTAVSATAEGWHFIIDVTDTVTPTVRFFILDPDLQVQASIVVPTTLPTLSTTMGLVMGSRRINGIGVNPALQVVHASLVNDATVSGQGGGTVSGLTLAQVLINGNTTGATTISVNQGSGIVGVTDDNLGDGASFGVFGGATTLATNDTGNISVASGNAFGGGAENPGSTTGFAQVATGFQFGVASQGDTGLVTVWSGSHLGTDGTTGALVLATGFFTNAAAGARTTGDILIAPGTFSPGTSTVNGEVIIKGGSSSLTGVVGGDITIMSGENSSAAGDTGDIIVETFPANLAGDSGGLELKTGDAGTVSGSSGNIDIETGPGVAGGTGAVAITTGDAGNGDAGQILVACGDGTGVFGSDITIVAGDTINAIGTGGNIVLNPGNGGAGPGEVTVNGKLTVTGLIDPTGLLLNGQLVVPTAVPPGDGLLWIDSTGAPSRLIFTDDAGTPHDISTGGGVTSLGALTDVTLTAPAPGEVLTYNGVDWVNLAGAGGSPLATILGIGNTTGALPIVVSDTLGARITSDGNLVLDPGVGIGNRVVVDGLAWPESDGLAGYVLTTNGLGTLSFQPGGGGGGGPSFGEAFTRMQWGSVQASDNGAAAFKADGILSNVTLTSNSPTFVTNDIDGHTVVFDTAAAPASSAGWEIEQTGPGVGIELQSLPLASFKFDAPSLDTNIRFFVGFTDSPTLPGQTGSDTPGQRYVGLQLYTPIPQATFHFVTDNTTGNPTTFNTGVTATGTGFELVVDATVAGSVTLTLYDRTGTQLAQTTFAANLPTATVGLGMQVGMTTTNGAAKTSGFYTASVVTRGDLLNAVGGGGGNQNLFSVLGFGAETGGVPIQGDDNVAGSGGDLDLIGGTSSGGGGAGGSINLSSGAPDPGGIGGAGDITMATANGAGTGAGGDFSVTLGNGGPGGGTGGAMGIVLGDGIGTGSGGALLLSAGDSGTAGGGFAGAIGFTTGSSGVGGGATGGRFQVITGNGDGTADGGDVLFTAGDGGAGGGDGGSFAFTVGTGNGGGADGIFSVTGDVTITGKLTVGGMIDPPGLLMSSSGLVPFTPVGSEGGIWVNGAGELVYTNSGGDLNLSTAIGGGMTFLDAMLTAGYGMLSAGNPSSGPQSYGVYGSSSVTAVTPGPPPASAVFGEDSDGPFTNIAVGAAALSEAFIGTADLMIQRDSQFKARFKFQVTSPAHTDERLFIGFTNDPALVTPSAQLAADDPAALRYMGLREDLAGFNLSFVARGSGGAMVPVFGLPTDALVHYLEIDASAASGDVTFTVYDADGVTISAGGSATHTEPASLLLPDLATALRPFFGIHTGTGTTPRGMDFYLTTIVTRADVVDAVTGGGGGGGTPVLSAVLAAGNNAGGTPIEADGGIDGGTVTLSLSGGAGGGAASPGTLSLSVEAGNNGGAATLAAGDGAGAAGAGGVARVSAGDGSGTGAGGSVLVTSGDGGATGDAGDLTLAPGTPGAGGVFGTAFLLGEQTAPVPASLVGLEDGAVVAIGATNGTASGAVLALLRGEVTGAGRGGPAAIQGGNASVASNAVGGGVTLQGGVGDGTGGGGNITLVSGVGGATGSGGLISILGAPAVGASGGDGGDIVLTGGAQDGAGDAGSIYLFGDGASAVATITPGGDIQIAGAVNAGNANGGRIVVDGGSPLIGGSTTVIGGSAIAASGLSGGTASLLSGNGDGAAGGGFALVRGGEGGATGNGGDAQIRGGGATGGANVGGDVRLIPGTGPAGAGTVQIEGKIDPAVGAGLAGIQYGTFFLAGPVPAAAPIPFNTVFGAPPTTILLTMEAAAAALPPGNDVTPTVAPGSITAAGFTLNMSSAGVIPGPITLHWVAFR